MTGPRADTERRRFLKGVVGGAAAVSLATAGAVSVETMTSTRSRGGGLIGYRGISNVTGPAPRALPQVPLTVDEEGYLRGRWPDTGSDGVPSATLGGVTYSADWFRYCGFEEHDGFRPERTQTAYLRAATDAPYEWQAEQFEAGERLHVDDFADYRDWGNGIGTAGLGKPAMAQWRSEDTDRSFPVQVLRSSRIGEMHDRGGEWIRASTSRDFLAWAATCTYKCTTTAFKGYEASEVFDAGDLVYCPKHQSLFDPFEVVSAQYIAPEWNEG